MKDSAYFDNAATSFPKPECVYDFMDSFYRNAGGNAGRGDYDIALSSGKLIDDTRGRMKELLLCPGKEIIFTPSATLALNMILQGLILDGIKNVYITPFEHNAVLRVLYHFESKGTIKVFLLSPEKDLRYDFDAIKIQFEKQKPDLLAISHVSNVCGLVQPVEKFCALAKKYGATTVIDMAQSAGLVELNVASTDIDFAVFAGHKTLHAPTGIAGFAMKKDFALELVLFGGTGYDSANQKMPEILPQKYEPGTANVSALAGLYAAVGWIQKVGVASIWEKEQEDRKQLLDILRGFDFVKIVGDFSGAECVFTGIVSCIVEGIPSDTAGGVFARTGIAVRSGLQCAPSAHKFLGTFPAGTIRFSPGYFTDDGDYDALRRVMAEIGDNLG